MSVKIEFPLLIRSAAVVGACVLFSSQATANPALGYNIAPGSGVTVSTEQQPRSYGDLSMGPSIGVGSSVTRGLDQPQVRAKKPDAQPNVIIHHPTGLKSMGTHPDAMGGTARRHRVSCGLNVCLDIQKRIAF